MGVEIERKFLLKNGDWRKFVTMSSRIRQGYMQNDAHATVRVRLIDDEAYLTLKAPQSASGVTRLEYEYPIPAEDANGLLDTICTPPLIEKIRHYIPAENGLMWEIDEFSGDNAGLVVAELELPAENTPYICPDWLGEEVTGDIRYYNSNLIKNPYSRWKD